ncbi:hypothetical protein [Halocola ammonii]
MLGAQLKYNRYKINRQPQRESGFVTVLLNLSNDENFTFVAEQAAERAINCGLEIRGLLLDLDQRANEKDIEQLSKRFRNELESHGFKGDAKIDVERKSFHKLIDSYFHESALIICDSGFTNTEKRWRHFLARTVGCEMVRVEKRRSNRFFNLDKVVERVSSEKITLPDLMSWVDRDVDLYYA